jgi:hypothetical protein
MYTRLNSYNSEKLLSLQTFECKALDHGSTKQTHATVSVTAPETNAGIRCCTSPNQALGGSTSRERLSDTFVRKVTT